MSSPLSILRDIEQRALASRQAGDQLGAAKVEWRGLSFHIGETELVTQMVGIFEVLEPVECTRIPRSKPWFYGIANVRGTLVPVMDLHHFLYGESLAITNNTRVIVFKLATSYLGLYVTSIGGLRHHYVDEQVDGPPQDMDGILAELVPKHFQLNEGVWGIFEVGKLIESEEFLKVAITENS